MNRREFLRTSISVIAGLSLGKLLRLGDENAESAGLAPRIVVAKGPSAEANTMKALDGLGGIGTFIKKGERVVIKPNIAWNKTPDQAATTNPAVVKALVQAAKKAGASEVIVIDYPCHPWNTTYVTSGMQAAVQEAGGTMKPPLRFRNVAIPGGVLLKEAEILEEILNTDAIINVPIVKVHGSQSNVSIAMKNLMGVVKNRGYFHSTGLNQCIADIASFVNVRLTVLDATRVLLTNGPQGPGTVKRLDTIAAGTDFVALDAFGTTLLGLSPENVPHIKMAAGKGLGQADLSKVTIQYL